MTRLSILLVLVCPLFLLADEPPTGRITIKAKDIPLSEALKTLGERTNARVVNSLGSDDKLNLNIDKATYWQALDAIATAASADVQLYREDGQVELIRRSSPARLPLSYSGPFRIGLRKLTVVNDFVQQSRGLTVSLEAAWEPGFEAFYLETRPRKVVLTDDAGKAIPIASSGSLWTPVDGKRALSFEVSLPAPPRAALKLDTFKGVLPVRAASRMHVFRWKGQNGDELNLPALAGAKLPLYQRAGPGETLCSVTKVKLSASRWTMQVGVELPAGGPEFESFETWYANNEVYLQSRDGKRKLRPSTFPDQESASTRKVVLNYHFTSAERGNATDWVLVCRVPASIVQLDIPFEFRNVELR